MQIQVGITSVTGQGLTSGIRYDARGDSNFKFYADSAGFPFHLSLTETFLMVGRGGLGGKFNVSGGLTTTINANGDMTVDIDKLTFRCN